MWLLEQVKVASLFWMFLSGPADILISYKLYAKTVRMENIENILQTIKLKHWLIMKSWEVETDPFGDLYSPIKAAGFLKEIYYCYADYRITAKSAQAKSSSGSFFFF